MDETLYQCEAFLSSVPKTEELTYRMIVAEFDAEQPLLQAIVNTQVLQREPNVLLFKYRKVLSFIFLLISVANLVLFSAKIYQLEGEQIGFIKSLHFLTLLLLVLYNLLYATVNQEVGAWFTNIFDNFLNASMMTAVLFENLVLIDAFNGENEVDVFTKIKCWIQGLCQQAASDRDRVSVNSTESEATHDQSMQSARSHLRPTFQNADERIRAFFVPKMAICAMIFFTLSVFMYTHSLRLTKYITELEQTHHKIHAGSLFGTSFSFTDLLCLCLFVVYATFSLMGSLQAFCQAHERFSSLKDKRINNLHNLIFA